MGDACPRCGGPTVLLLYSRVCREACDRRVVDLVQPPPGAPQGRIVASFRAEHIVHSDSQFTRWVIPGGTYVTLVEGHETPPAENHWTGIPGRSLPIAFSRPPHHEMPALVCGGVKYSPVPIIGMGWDIVARELDPSDPEYVP